MAIPLAPPPRPHLTIVREWYAKPPRHVTRTRMGGEPVALARRGGLPEVGCVYCGVTGEAMRQSQLTWGRSLIHS
jgi:hypothetical protein